MAEGIGDDTLQIQEKAVTEEAERQSRVKRIGELRQEVTTQISDALQAKHAPADLFDQIKEINPELGSKARQAAIHQAVETLKAEHTSLIDPLTGLSSRLRFQQEFSAALAELERSPEQSGPSWLLHFDIDKFKTVNDTLGHDVGDKVLRLIGQLPRANERIYRVGGEEFMQFLRGVPKEKLVLLLQRYSETMRTLSQQALKDTSESIPGSPQKVTLSFGITEINSNNVEDVVKNSDISLYHSKETGRDKGSIFLGKNEQGEDVFEDITTRRLPAQKEPDK